MQSKMVVDITAAELAASFFGMSVPTAKKRFFRKDPKLYKPNGSRECDRRIRQNASFRQFKSHQYTTTRPKHIFGIAS